MKQVKKIVYYFIMILFILLIEPIISFFKYSDTYTTINNVLELENASLKMDIKELSHIDYSSYDYILAKITIKNLYDSNVYYLLADEEIKPNLPVINQFGLIGITTDSNTMTAINNLPLSIKINNIIGKYENNQVTINTTIKNGDNVYTSGLTNIPANILIGTVKDVNTLDNDLYTASIDLVANNSNYVAILKEY